MIKAIIIDDEAKSRKLLRNLLNNYCPEIEIIDMADSVGSGVKSVKKNEPDLIFLDIEMPDGTGFDLLEKIGNLQPEVIFATAYDQYAIQAIHLSVLDYLLKPINLDDLKTAVSKVNSKINERVEKQTVNQSLKVLLKNSKAQTNNKKIGL